MADDDGGKNLDPIEQLRVVASLYMSERLVRQNMPGLSKDADEITLSRDMLVNVVALGIKAGWEYRDRGEGVAVFDLLKSGRDILASLAKDKDEGK